MSGIAILPVLAGGAHGPPVFVTHAGQAVPRFSQTPAAAAYQLTYSMKKMFLLSAGFGVLASLVGLFLSYFFDLPSGATIVVTSSVIFLLAVIFSPKRKVKRWQQKPASEETP